MNASIRSAVLDVGGHAVDVTAVRLSSRYGVEVWQIGIGRIGRLLAAVHASAQPDRGLFRIGAGGGVSFGSMPSAVFDALHVTLPTLLG